ncbi:MocR-like ectoine utilization transcription factor EhuR [Inquilinus sp. CA228]|uniref:MocR-like ectoine utilization transcription factor EhuR n=1 Tax=Inquilinus sp. CA228 TaxID=3455609 RepID=UPI003F8D7CD0
MTIWQPDPAALRRPAYLSLADQIARAISDGRLQPGERLATHRQMAETLDLSVQTVSRAYEELIRRGLISGETGRGTFIRPPQREPVPPYIPERLSEVIDLSILKPVVCETLHIDAMKAALHDLADTLPHSAVLSFRPNTLFARHRRVAQGWLREHCGVEATPGTIHLTNGATSGMTIALMAAAPPGSTVVTEAVGHHTLVPLAAYLGLRLRGVAIDAEGVIPEALDEACSEGDVRALFVMPNPINATASLMGEARRAEIVAVARRHGLQIIENDVLAPLLSERLPPLAALAPERTLYVTTFTKCVMPGLRAGYLVVPDRLCPAVANRSLVTSWMATGLIAELAARWVENGTAAELVRWQVEAIRGRQAIAAEILAGIPHKAHPQGLHVWLPLGERRSEEEFVSHARLQGVAIAPGASFAIGGASEGGMDRQPAVRISVGSTTPEQLRDGLKIVVNLLQGEPEPVLLAM